MFVNVHVCVHGLVFLVFTLHVCLCARACIDEACIDVKQYLVQVARGLEVELEVEEEMQCSRANSSETREPLESAGKCSAPRPSQLAVVALAHTDAAAAQT
jgi:hypothetical protein